MWHRKKSESFRSSLQGNYRWVSINAGTVHFSRKCFLVRIQTRECKSQTNLSSFYGDSHYLFDQQNYCQTTCQILCLLKWREMYPNAYMDIRNKSKYVFGEGKLKYWNEKSIHLYTTEKFISKAIWILCNQNVWRTKKSLKNSLNLMRLSDRSKVEKNMINELL